MNHGTEHRATMREIMLNALSPNTTGSLNEMLTDALLQLSYEHTVLMEYILLPEGDRCPLSDHILAGASRGIAERARSLAALVSAQLSVEWKGSRS